MTIFNLPTPDEKNLLRISAAIRSLARGRSNAKSQVTLTANAGSTVVAFTNCSQNSGVFLSPRTANAAAALATTYVSSVGNETFTITHANNAQVDKTFDFLCIG